MEIIFIVGWLLVTLLGISLVGIIAKKYGVEYLLAAMGFAILITNVMNIKFATVLGYAIPAGTLMFSMTFVISDMLSEFWGKAQAQKAVWIGFMGILMYLVILVITLQWAPAGFATETSEKFGDLFAIAPRIALGSLLAYLVAQNFDVWFYHKIKSYTGDRLLWLRNCASTIASQLLDSVVFFSVAFAWSAMFPTLTSLIMPIVTLWLIKVVIALIDTPFMYLVRYIIKKA